MGHVVAVLALVMVVVVAVRFVVSMSAIRAERTGDPSAERLRLLAFRLRFVVVALFLVGIVLVVVWSVAL